MLHASQNLKPGHVGSAFDKENNSISSNILFERKQSFSRKYKKTNELVVKPQISSQTETLNTLTNTLHTHQGSYLQTKFLEELDAARKVNASKVKKSIIFESRNSVPAEDSNHNKALISNYSSMDADREKTAILIFERDREKRPVSDSFIPKKDIKIVAIETPKKSSRPVDFKLQQTKLIEPYLSCIIDSLKEKDVNTLKLDHII